MKGRDISSTKERPSTITGLDQTEQQDPDPVTGKPRAKISL